MIKPRHQLKKTRTERLRKSLKKRIKGTAEKPRLIIFMSNKFLYSQVVDDQNGKVLIAASTLEKEIKAKLKSAKNKEAAKLLGELLAERLKEKKIEAVVFDRNIYAFTGRVKIFADSAREKGIRF